MNAQAPAGWYPDGQGNERYWDGSAWTEQLRHPEVADATSAASSSAQKEGAFSKLRKVAADKHAEKRSAREELDRKQADDAHAEVVHVDPDRLPGWFPFAAGGGVVAETGGRKPTRSPAAPRFCPPSHCCLSRWR